jgi:hypothetical protein
MVARGSARAIAELRDLYFFGGNVAGMKCRYLEEPARRRWQRIGREPRAMRDSYDRR